MRKILRLIALFSLLSRKTRYGPFIRDLWAIFVVCQVLVIGYYGYQSYRLPRYGGLRCMKIRVVNRIRG